MNGIVVLQKRPQGTLLPLLLGEDTGRRGLSRTRKQARRSVCRHLDLGLAFTTVRNMFVASATQCVVFFL